MPPGRGGDGGRTDPLLTSAEDGLAARVRALWELQSLYPRASVVRRVEPDGAVRLSDGEALIRYRPSPRMSLPRSWTPGAVLPAGVTRFRVRERVLGVRYPLDRMKDGDPRDRNAELRAFVREPLEREPRPVLQGARRALRVIGMPGEGITPTRRGCRRRETLQFRGRITAVAGGWPCERRRGSA